MPRLKELANIYTAYQAQLQTQGWADRVGLHWLAVEALSERASDICKNWSIYFLWEGSELSITSADADTLERNLAVLGEIKWSVGSQKSWPNGKDQLGEVKEALHKRAATTVYSLALPRAGQAVYRWRCQTIYLPFSWR